VGPQAKSDEHWRGLLAEQVRLHARLWFRLAYDILRDAHAAEDVTQQALLRGWANRDQLRDGGQLRAWISRTVINESLVVLRHRRVARRALDKQSCYDSTAEHAPDQTAMRETVVIGLSALSEPVRAVVALRIMEGMSGNDVKDLLGCSAAQVSRMLHQGLDQLRTVLAGDDAGAKKDGDHAVQ